MKKIAFILLTVILLSLNACAGSSDSSGSKSDKTYTVTFDSNGGSEVEKKDVSSLDQAPKTTKEGYVFCGWYSDKNLISPISYPFNVKEKTTLYAKWQKATEVFECADATIQFSYDGSYSYSANYPATPKEFDLKALASQGYYVKIDVSYEAYYEKNYDVPFDIGYQGAPNHDVLLANEDEAGTVNKDILTKDTATPGSISLVVSAEKMMKESYYLTFRTYNLQNIVRIKNIVITFTCLEEKP